MRARVFITFVAAALISACGSNGSQSSSSVGNLGGPSPTNTNTSTNTTPPATTARGTLSFSTTASKGWTSIDITVDGTYQGTLLHYFPASSSSASSCVAVADARIVVALTAGSHTYSARTNHGGTWTGNASVPADNCQEVVLTCKNDDCSQ